MVLSDVNLVLVMCQVYYMKILKSSKEKLWPFSYKFFILFVHIQYGNNIINAFFCVLNFYFILNPANSYLIQLKEMVKTGLNSLIIPD